MPRNPRFEYPGANYHVMSRANRKGNIFETDVDRLDFVKSLAETCTKTGFQVHAYCLMRNHFHLVVETQNARAFTKENHTDDPLRVCAKINSNFAGGNWDFWRGANDAHTCFGL